MKCYLPRLDCITLHLQGKDFIKSHWDGKPTRLLTFSHHIEVKADTSWFKWLSQSKDDIWYHLNVVRKWQEVSCWCQTLTCEKFEIFSSKILCEGLSVKNLSLKMLHIIWVELLEVNLLACGKYLLLNSKASINWYRSVRFLIYINSENTAIWSTHERLHEVNGDNYIFNVSEQLSDQVFFSWRFKPFHWELKLAAWLFMFS